MNNYKINAIATQALVDPEFRTAILHGRRREQLKQFDLPHDLVEAIMSFKGDSLHHFIIQLNNLNTTSARQMLPAV